MITGEIKSAIDKIWNDFWTGGIANPLTVIEQFTYLIFIKQLDDRQIRMEKEANLLGISMDKPIYSEKQKPLRWSNFKNKDPEIMFDLFTKPQRDIDDLTAFDFMKTLGAKGGEFARFMKGAIFMIQSPKLLDKVVQQIDALPLDNRDTKGDLYEYMLSKIAEAGTNGQFRTPRHIIEMMVEMAQPKQDDIICDPACGTAGFLVVSGEYIYDNHKDWFQDKEFRTHFNTNMFHGNEFDPSMLRIAAMNLQLHGMETPVLTGKDALSEANSDVNDAYTLILANPPFKGSLDYDEVESSLLQTTKTKKTELLFLSLMLRTLKVGGRAAVIVPDGVLFGSSKAHKGIREELVNNQKLEAVISMPSGVFKPYAGVSTAILFFTKTNSGGTDKVWFYDMKADGYSLDDNRKIINENDIPDILKRFKNLENEVNRARTEQSFLVPFDEIKRNDWGLSINSYKEIVYEEIKYDSPASIISSIEDLDRQRNEALNALKDMLS
ncbi:type I restriction-modification system subunit M [Gelidibacter japonicus]|uniref:type I restriction-modification system subunit M n=1 Tax=Gelidibacter japonicus TaxID=1962232 RepID=UPI003A92B5C8